VVCYLKFGFQFDSGAIGRSFFWMGQPKCGVRASDEDQRQKRQTPGRSRVWDTTKCSLKYNHLKLYRCTTNLLLSSFLIHSSVLFDVDTLNDVSGSVSKTPQSHDGQNKLFDDFALLHARLQRPRGGFTITSKGEYKH
jgi:hypothetical protein